MCHFTFAVFFTSIMTPSLTEGKHQDSFLLDNKNVKPTHLFIAFSYVNFAQDIFDIKCIFFPFSSMCAQIRLVV